MSALPPPTGAAVDVTPPTALTDPWLEQARRRAVHERARRRRRMQRAGVVLVAIGVVAAAVAAFVLLTSSSAVAPPAPSSRPVPTSPPPSSAPVTIAADELVRIDDVWLVDRGDGVFDWGVTVLAAPLAPTRSGVEIEVRLVDATGETVETVVRSVDGVDVDSPGAAIGRLVDPDVAPVRIEFDVAVGVQSNDAAFDEFLAVRSLRRSDDELTGLVRSTSNTAVTGVTAVFVWRDEVGDVVATAFQPVDEVRPGIDARFELDLAERNVPDGRPDDVFWIPEN